MDLIKSSPRRRSHITEFAYAALNAALAIIILLVVLSTQSLWLPILLVLLSKWRVLAVRPRFWKANILANLVDIIVGLSFVVTIFYASGALWFQVGMTLAYIVWLLFIKPRSKRAFVTTQALVAVFLGVNALSTLAYALDPFFFVVGMFIIGFASFRHVLMHYDDSLTTYISLIGGLFMAELGWFGYHWLFAYSMPGAGAIKIAQLAIIATLLGFLSERIYEVQRRKGEVHAQDIMLPIIFTVLLVVILLLFFNNVAPTGSI